MSQGQKWPLARAKSLAEKIVDALAPHCERIAIAGSIRREKPEVGDIEILYIPRVVTVRTDLLTESPVDMAEIELTAWLDSGRLSKRPNVRGSFTWGPKNKLALHRSGFACDFFATSAENWWNSLVVRTGSKDTNLALTMGAQKLGRSLQAYGCGVKESDGTVTPAVSEEHVFELCGVNYLPPTQR